MSSVLRLDLNRGPHVQNQHTLPSSAEYGPLAFIMKFIKGQSLAFFYFTVPSKHCRVGMITLVSETSKYKQLKVYIRQLFSENVVKEENQCLLF